MLLFEKDMDIITFIVGRKSNEENYLLVIRTYISVKNCITILMR